LHAWFNEQERNSEAVLYGRRLYETMAAYWPTYESDPNATDVMREFGRIWNAKPKIVFSSTLRDVQWNGRLVSGDVGELLEQLRAEFDGDLEVGGPTLAAEFVRRNLVDDYRVVVHPVVLGGGTPYLPRLDKPITLRLTETRTFAYGVTMLSYAAR
jgi:dihydrofolate reductase